MTSARPLDAPPSQLPAATSGTPGGSHRCGCVGHLSMWRQRCLMPAAGSPVSAMSTVTPKAKPSVSSVATPACKLQHTRGGSKALRWGVAEGRQAEGGGGGALDRVEEGGGSADCTDGGDGGVGSAALLGHARQAKVRQPRLAARVEEDVARLDLHAVIGAQVCGGACLRQGFPGPTHPAICADGHSFTRGGYVAVQQDGLLRVQVHQRARRVA
eukprot:scaffold18680_cov73-Phaeocystis_antarctica.AAC.2